MEVPCGRHPVRWLPGRDCEGGRRRLRALAQPSVGGLLIPAGDGRPGLGTYREADLRVGLVYLGRRGGGAVYALEVAQALSCLCSVLCVASSNAENVVSWRSSGLEVIEVATPRGVGGVPLQTVRFLGDQKFWRKLQAAAVDVLYYPMIHVWAPLVNHRLAKTPVVTTIHDAKPHLGEESLILGLVQKACIRRSAGLIALSKSSADELITAGSDPARISVLPLGEFSWYARCGADAGQQARADHQTLLYFGRIAAYKGIDVLLDAFSMVRAQVPGCRLVLAGEGDIGPYRKRLHKLDGVDLTNRWIADDEVASYFQCADVVVLPYVGASQSGVVAIAAALGLPVVASRVGGLAEQVSDGKTGLLVEPGSAAGLAEACVRLLKDRELRGRLGRAAKDCAESEWGWGRIAGGVLSACKRAVASSKRVAH